MEAIAAIVIFVLMFALIILDKIPRHYITLGCAAATLIIVFGVCMKSPQAIMETLNLKTIITGNFWISSGESSSSGINWETIIFVAGGGHGQGGLFPLAVPDHSQGGKI